MREGHLTSPAEAGTGGSFSLHLTQLNRVQHSLLYPLGKVFFFFGWTLEINPSVISPAFLTVGGFVLEIMVVLMPNLGVEIALI